MKFTCSQAALLKAINVCSKAVAVRTTIPILKGFLISIKDGRATLTSSNLNMTIETSFDVQNSEDGSTVIPAKLISDIVRKLPNSLISFNCEPGLNNVSISCLGSDFSLVTLPADEFPVISNLSNSDYADIDKNDFKELINKVLFSAAIDEKKGVLTGCLFNLKEDGIEAVAIDGFRMAIARKNTSAGKERTVIIPATILAEIYKILNEDEGSDTITVNFEDKKAEFLTEDTRVNTRLFEGEFIKYNDIIPKTFSSKVVVYREDLLNAIERASILGREGKNNVIKLSVNGSSLVIDSKSEDGFVKESIEVETDGENLSVGFNAKFITDVLKAIEDQEIVLKLSNGLGPCLIVPLEGEDYLYLIGTVRVNF